MRPVGTRVDRSRESARRPTSGPFTPELAAGSGRSNAWRHPLALRLFVTVWLVFVVHFASNVVRETYLAISLGERFSVRVDEYLGLHPDLFAIEGRGAYINNNPGASMLGAIPYAVARPFIDGLFRLKPELATPKPPASYDDPRPNRTKFMNEARARGLDIKLGLAAVSMQVGLMAPLGALAAVVLFFFLRARLRDEKLALLLACLYAFGTPVFFRSAHLNQNLIVAHATLFAFVLLAGPSPRGPSNWRRSHLLGAGASLGFGVVCDYSAAPLLAAFGLWILALSWRHGGWREGVRTSVVYSVGALAALLLLLGYQWMAFGHPLFPAQTYMPSTPYSGFGWHGLMLPDPDLLWRNLVDLRYGLFTFCPMLVAAMVAPLLREGPDRPAARELWLVFGASLALYLFSSSVSYAHLQWNTGVRYMVPAVPLLFVALVPVLLRSPRIVSFGLVIPTVVVSWSVSMAREDVPTSLTRVFVRGFELPWLTVLEKTSSAYAPFLEHGTSPLPIFLLVGLILWLVWRRVEYRAPAGTGRG